MYQNSRSRRLLSVISLLVISSLSIGFFSVLWGEDERPNIIVIMADDLGYSDLGCYGGEIHTPNIDSLAAEGLRFNQFYNASRCCPTRASLMTGKYPHEVGLINNGRSLDADVPTVAELLQYAGYQTAMAGKWHLSETKTLNNRGSFDKEHLKWLNNQLKNPPRYFSNPDTYPAARGFDQHYGVIWGVVNYFNPFSLVNNFDPVFDLPKNYYITDAINQRSADYIREFSKSDEPFFLYIAHTAPHWPLHAKEETMNKYEGMYDDGWENLRDARYKRLIEMGLIDPETHPLPEHNRGNSVSWDNLSDEEKEHEILRMQAHAAMIDEMDAGLAAVFDELKASGEWDNTLIFFLSDNGASPERTIRPGYDRPSETRDGRTINYKPTITKDMTGREIAFDGLGNAWANAANTPLRYWKKESYEGGCRTPMIMHWPNQIESSSIQTELGHVFDISATILDVAGVKYPKTFRGKQQAGLRGKSLVDALERDASPLHEILFFEHVGGAAVRTEKWKLVRLTPETPWDLYAISNDKTETHNVASEHPEVVSELANQWNAWWLEVTAGRIQ